MLNKCLRTMVVAVLLMPSFGSSWASSISVTLSPGGLAEHISRIEDERPSAVVLDGYCDVRDLRLLAERLPDSVDTLDMKALQIKRYEYPFSSSVDRGVYADGEIPPYVFAFSGFRSVVLPANTSVVSEGAFASSSIEEVCLGDGVERIGDYAFACCPRLCKATFRWRLRKIGKGAFEGCPSLKEIDFSQTAVTDFPERLLAGCTSLSSVKLPGIIKYVGTEAFANTAIGSVAVTRETECGDYALSSIPSLESVVIDGARSSKGMLFNNPRLAKGGATVGEVAPLYMAGNTSYADSRVIVSGTVIGEYSLAGIAVDSLVFGDGLREIRPNAFSRLDRLCLINAFALGGNLPEVVDESFSGIRPEGIRLGVNGDFIDVWKAHPIWGRFDIFAGISGIEDVVPDLSADDICISSDGKTVYVRASSVIASVALYSVSGSLVYASSPGNAETGIDVSAWKGSVLVADVTDVRGNRKSIKILID